MKFASRTCSSNRISLLTIAAVAVILTLAARCEAQSNLFAGLLDPSSDVLLAGGIGTDGESEQVTEIFHQDTGLFSRSGDLVEASADHSAILLPDGRVLIAGGAEVSGGQGIPEDRSELFNPRTGKFTRSGFMSKPRLLPTATLITGCRCPQDGKVLFAGGASPLTLASAELYDPATGQFSVLAAAMTEPRLGHTATPILKGPLAGQILLAGGFDANGFPLASAEIYNPATAKFTAIAGTPLHTARFGAQAELLSDGATVFIVGGQSSSSIDDYTDTAELFDSSTQSFTQLAAKMTDRRGIFTMSKLTVGALAGQYLIVGGVRDSDTTLATAELYDPGKKTFTCVGGVSPAPPLCRNVLPTPREGAAAVTLRAGRYAGQVLIAGGQYTSAGHPDVVLDTALLFDSATQKFSLTRNKLSAPQSGLSATQLAPQNFLSSVLGGLDRSLSRN